MLLQSGLTTHWWAEAMRCYCFLRNVSDIMVHGQTPYQKRFGDFKGKRVPFGASIRFMPMRHGEAVRAHPVGEKTSDGIFVGYHTHPGGKWSGDYWIIDVSDMVNADSVFFVHARRIGNIVVPDYATFPVRDGVVKQPTTPDRRPLPADDCEDDDNTASRSSRAVDEVLKELLLPLGKVVSDEGIPQHT